jgi:hypothetical protein
MAASSVDTAVDAFHKNIMRAMEKFILKDYICHGLISTREKGLLYEGGDLQLNKRISLSL